MNPKCKECQSIDIDHNFKKTFGCLVCNKCKSDLPEKYSLLTKTECKEVSSNAIQYPERPTRFLQDYLLTDCTCPLCLLTVHEDLSQPQRSFVIKRHCLTS